MSEELGKSITLSNGVFFAIRFEKDPDEKEVHIYQVYGGDQDIYCMSIKPEQLAEFIYQLTDMVDEQD
jgi:hypothetical protein